MLDRHVIRKQIRSVSLGCSDRTGKDSGLKCVMRILLRFEMKTPRDLDEIQDNLSIILCV